MSELYSVFAERPKDFAPSVEVAGCFCVWDGRILLLERNLSRPQGGTWNLPAGKKEGDETSLQTVIREVKEETGLSLLAEDLSYISALYIAIPGYHYVFHVYYTQFLEKPQITLDQTEHVAFKWITPDEALQLPLIMGGKEVLSLFQSLNRS